MLNVTVEIKAPDIVEVIKLLIQSLAGDCLYKARERRVDPTAPAVTLETPAQHANPPLEPTVQQVQQPVLSLAPTQPPQAGPVPTSVQTYTLDQLAVAATTLVDAGRRADLINLLALFGVPALTALSTEQYGNFATNLRSMGAKI